MRRLASWPAFLLGLVASCATPEAVTDWDAPADRPVTPVVLGPGDRIQVSVWREEELLRDLVVRPDGRISYPLVGDLKVAGLTIPETRKLLQRLLEEYLRRPQVTVTLERPASLRVRALGEVARPGDYPWHEADTLLALLARAGDLVPHTAYRSDLRVLRGLDGERPEALRVDLHRILRGEAPDLPLEPGDVVYVPSHPITDWGRVLAQCLGRRSR
ncbi:MAG: polysaccharide export protein [Planctomycetes bacterium]|nr:polysaccharide export protein [Planctomycetota bacterium]